MWTLHPCAAARGASDGSVQRTSSPSAPTRNLVTPVLCDARTGGAPGYVALDATFILRQATRVSPPSRARAEAPPDAERLEAELHDMLQAAVESAERGEGLDLTADEAQAYFESGELPARVHEAGEAWAAVWRASRG
jgi:hypothetical protein